MAHLAEELKEKGNAHFRRGEYESAVTLYGAAITKNPRNPLLYTNRANARLKLEAWDEVIDDCLKSIELMRDNMKAFFYLAQAQLAINHPNEALSSALTAYDLCVHSVSQTSSASLISALVVKCKRRKWEARERERLRRQSSLLAELEDRLERGACDELAALEARRAAGEVGEVEAAEERDEVSKTARTKLDDLRSLFAIADPSKMTKREVPDYLIDNITFEIMHDPVVTRNGHSYERATLIEHLKRSPTDPLTRDPLHVSDLRPNVALRQACEEFVESNSAWIYDW
ncbi:hypothetical protein BDY21DRAFT_351112 [Lineolata rhizophorae]|uniref:U-box domain-containing protein n=1 Tax=Lineolata rhizophorae TaxID=578093 RepID=A0A6A6NTK6_9PEZI|nr:hypothetical protein BDY21DRAFT_351112 [Lineolata rhizophorae]